MNGRTTTDGQPPNEDFLAAHKYNAPAPQPIDPATGQHKAYWVLTEAERAKGFIRPVRRSYQHVGERPKYPLRDLTVWEAETYKHSGYVKFEEYPPNEKSTALGRFWTLAQLRSGCGAVTTMGTAIAETYAREPHFYGSTFCTRCATHLPVCEFVWIEIDGLTKNERLGT